MFYPSINFLSYQINFSRFKFAYQKLLFILKASHSMKLLAKFLAKQYRNSALELLLGISWRATVASSVFLGIPQLLTPLTGSKGLPQLIIGLWLDFSMKITDCYDFYQFSKTDNLSHYQWWRHSIICFRGTRKLFSEVKNHLLIHLTQILSAEPG